MSLQGQLYLYLREPKGSSKYSQKLATVTWVWWIQSTSSHPTPARPLQHYPPTYAEVSHVVSSLQVFWPKLYTNVNKYIL